MIIEGERAIVEAVILNLKRVDYEYEYAQDGGMGAAMVEKQSYDLVPLDIMLPKINDYELMRYLAQLQTPVVFITTKGSVQNRVRDLHVGADDYLVKPFAVDGLTARVESMLHCYHKSMQDTHVLNVTIHTATCLMEKESRTITLAKKEYELLLYLVQNKNITLCRDMTYEKVWHEEEFEQTRTLDLHIQRLRKKLDWYRVIRIVYKIGYVLEVRGEVQR